jgi:hypothetical protein
MNYWGNRDSATVTIAMKMIGTFDCCPYHVGTTQIKPMLPVLATILSTREDHMIATMRSDASGSAKKEQFSKRRHQ